jgi:hypothetical protein
MDKRREFVSFLEAITTPENKHLVGAVQQAFTEAYANAVAPIGGTAYWAPQSPQRMSQRLSAAPASQEEAAPVAQFTPAQLRNIRGLVTGIKRYLSENPEETIAEFGDVAKLILDAKAARGGQRDSRLASLAGKPQSRFGRALSALGLGDGVDTGLSDADE